MKITDAMKRTGLSRKAIYVYEERGLLTPAKGEQGYRDYSEEDVNRLLLIAKLRELDIPLEDIARVLQVPEETDILMQKHLQAMQNRLQEDMHKLSQMRTILYNLPPNGQLDDFIRATNIAIPDEMAIASARYLSEDPTLSSARRLTMHMFETFLDVPLDTPERLDAWYELLGIMENASSRLWDGYEEYYGAMTTEQRYEDYRLRRALVVGYTKYTPEDEKEKAAEIISRLRQFLTDPGYVKRWLRYYRLIVVPTGNGFDPSARTKDLMELLSEVYLPYNRKFNEIMDTYVYPYLRTQEGYQLCIGLKKVLGDAYDLAPMPMIYFDFWNHTIER